MIDYITEDNIKKIHTKRLLQIYRQLAINPEYGGYDWECNEFLDTDRIKMVKKELDTREHVPNKIEAKKLRQEAAKKHKGGRRSHKIK